MEKRIQDLSELKNFIAKVDNDITMVLQSIQWDKKNVLQGTDMVVCSFNVNHRIPATSKLKHEEECMLKHWGYLKDEKFLPEPAYPESKTCVTLCKDKIQDIINNASKFDPLYKKGIRNKGPEPMTHERLQCMYTADERRSLYDAVIATVPTSVEDLDLVLPSGSEEAHNSSKEKTMLQLLAEQRDMKRRRVKYRVATKSKNYSQVLHEVIRSQMEMYSDIKQSVDTNKQSNYNKNNEDSKKNKTEEPPDTERRKYKTDYKSKHEIYSKKDYYNKYDSYDKQRDFYERNKKFKYVNDDRSSSKTTDRSTEADIYSTKEKKYDDIKDHKLHRNDTVPTNIINKNDNYKKYDYYHEHQKTKNQDKYETSTSGTSKYTTKEKRSSSKDNYKGDRKRKTEEKYYKRYCDEYDDEEKYDKVKKHKSSKGKSRESSKSYENYSKKTDEKN